MKITLVGFGIVGRSFIDLLDLRSTELKKNYGLNIEVVAIVDRGGAAISRKGVNLKKVLEIKKHTGTVSSIKRYGNHEWSACEVIEEVESDMVVSVTPSNFKTGEPGRTIIEKALSSGEHVVTADKAALAGSLPNLLGLAHKNKVFLKFNSAVGAGMPILELGKTCLFGEKIESISGILNGTTNYILWIMAKERIELTEAIWEAKDRGYAEEEVLNDIDGLDTACKLVIIANWIMNRKVTLKDVKISGIRNISLEDVVNAEKRGFGIRLVGSINSRLTVNPTKISLNDPLCVESSLNAIALNTSYSGKHILIGQGAGGISTATSIIRDIIDITQKMEKLSKI